MTPSQQAKAAGLKSLLQVSELTGVSTQTLSNWAVSKPKLFRRVIVGCCFDKTMNEVEWPAPVKPEDVPGNKLLLDEQGKLNGWL